MIDQMFNQVTNGTSSFNEAVKSISSSLYRFATHERFSTLKHGIEFTLQQIDGDVEILEKKVSLTPVTDFLKRNMASAPGEDDGLNLESLIKRIREPYRTFYSCKFGHDVDEQANTPCEHRVSVRGTETVCGEPRVIASYHFSLDQWLKHFMRDPKFAMHIRDGPEELSREQNYPDVLSLWKGAAMTRLAEWVDLSLENHVPIVIQMFIDGFEPTESTRSVWVVIVRAVGAADTTSASSAPLVANFSSSQSPPSRFVRLLTPKFTSCDLKNSCKLPANYQLEPAPPPPPCPPPNDVELDP